jgi:hypothetical protein
LTNILVTACGSVGGINFVNALHQVPHHPYSIIGADYYPLNAKLCDYDAFYKSPRHRRPEYPELIREIVKKEKVDFIHPSLEGEARVIAIHCSDTKAKTFLPSTETSGVCQSKSLICDKLTSNCNLAKPSFHYRNFKKSLRVLFKNFGSPLWVRYDKGAGGRGSLKCEDPEAIHKWISLMVHLGKGKEKHFIIQPYLPGADYAFDSIWRNGELVTSFTRKRLSYLFPHLSLSGITGTPTASQIVYNDRVNVTAKNAVLTVDPSPHGIFCVDLKEDAEGVPFVTEVNCKPHTTMFLWSQISKHYSLLGYNLAHVYTMLGLGKIKQTCLSQFNLYPEDLILLRTIDAGVILIDKDEKVRLK